MCRVAAALKNPEWQNSPEKPWNPLKNPWISPQDPENKHFKNLIICFFSCGCTQNKKFWQILKKIPSSLRSHFYYWFYIDIILICISFNHLKFTFIRCKTHFCALIANFIQQKYGLKTLKLGPDSRGPWKTL